MISKVGNDAHGEFILHDLQKEGVGTQCIVNTPGLATGFVYVLVDPRNQTRTCIATPVQEELTSTDMESVLTQLTTSSSTSSHNTSTHTPTSVHSTTYIDDISLVHLDSRHPLAASVLTQWAYRHGIPVSIDVEKDRPPYLLPLLPLCTFVFTNETFSRAYCRLLSRPHSDKSTNSTTSTIRKYKLIETSNTTKNNTYNNSTNEWISIDVYNGDKLEEGLGQIDSL